MATQPKQQLDAGRVTQLAVGYWISSVLLAAVELGVFTALGAARRPLSADELDEQLELTAPSSGDFYDALVGLGLLTRDVAGYRNTEEAAVLLDERSPSFARHVFATANTDGYRRWADIVEVLRTGAPVASMFDGLDADTDRLRSFVATITMAMKPSFAALPEAFDFGSVGSVCDVGGAAGDLVIELVRRHPHLRCTVFDRPALRPVAQAAVKDAGLQDRIEFVAGDFFTDDLPAADVLVMSMVLLDWPEPRKRLLISAAYRAVPKGGFYLVLDRLDEPRRGAARRDLSRLLSSLDSLVHYGDAHHFTAEQLRAWCRDAGFARCDVQGLNGEVSLAVVRKEFVGDRSRRPHPHRGRDR